MEIASVKSGALSSSWLLTRLNSTSRRNRLFRAFHELGRVIRTIHMLEVLAEPGDSAGNGLFSTLALRSVSFA